MNQNDTIEAFEDTDVAVLSTTLSNDPEVAARNALRQQLASDVEAFLSSGGNIQAVPSGVRADPPKKPEPKYGGGSI